MAVQFGRISAAALVAAMFAFGGPVAVHAQSVSGNVVTLADASGTAIDVSNQIAQIQAAMADPQAFQTLVLSAAQQSPSLAAAIVAWASNASPSQAANYVTLALQAVNGTPFEGSSSLIAASTAGLPSVNAASVNAAVQAAPGISGSTKTQVASVISAPAGGPGLAAGGGGGVAPGGTLLGGAPAGGGGGSAPGTGGGAS